MADRTLDDDLKTSLTDNVPYSYFHLIKFEKPKAVASSGFVSGKATDYAYITDASINVGFDDLSKDSKQNLNGSQTYVANKVLSVGTVNETTQAKASNMSLVLSGTALGTVITTNAAFTTSSMTTTTDLLEAGYQEGDVLLLESTGNANNNKYVRINKFTNDNKTVSLTPIDTSLTAVSSNQVYTISFASEEISSLIGNKEATNYVNYVNREVMIYRAHSNPETGVIIGTPFLIFRGIISKGSIAEDAFKSSKVSWNLTSHWGDFVRVQSRMTSDSAHRALSTTGRSDVDALIRPEYEFDAGFAHAERSINLIATYQAQETRFKMKKRGGFAGLIGGKKTVEYQVEVDREVDLQFNLSAQSLPVVYGIQKVDSIPVFADILSSNAKEVYVAHAFCEGEIGGIYDIHVEDNSTVCLDLNDSNARSAAVATDAAVVCYGRADKGDVLAGSSSRSGTALNFNPFGDLFNFSINIGGEGGMNNVSFVPSFGYSLNSSGGQGLQHETTFSLASSGSSAAPATVFVHTGKPNQDANDLLVQKAAGKEFKLQTTVPELNKNNYWSPNHRLLDTAYVVSKYLIGEGETTIPKLEFVVRGKKIRAYNYDYSYDEDSVNGNASHALFKLGDTVTLHHTSTNVQIGSAVTITDKWSHYKSTINLSYKFRFSANPQDGVATSFYMKSATGNHRWHMITHDHTESASAYLENGVAPTATVVSLSNYTATQSVGGGYREITFANQAPFYDHCNIGDFVSLNFAGESNHAIFRVLEKGNILLRNMIRVADTRSGMNTIKSKFNALTGSAVCTLRNHNLVNLNNASSTISGAYNGRGIEILRYDSSDIITQKIERDIVSYIYTSANAQKYIARLSDPMPYDFSPTTGDFYSVSAGENGNDSRVSINPALQLLDYLKSKRYGKGLEDSDINLASFLQAARDCDTPSDVTIQVPGTVTFNAGALASNPTYKIEGNSSLLFQGTVKSATPLNVNIESGGSTTSTAFTEIVFTNVIGKLGYKWNNWRYFLEGEYYWIDGKVWQASAAGTITTRPTTGNLTSNLTLVKVSGSGNTILAASILDGFTASGNPIVKKFTNVTEGFNSPGYSLYDSDDVKYWKYVGWEEPEQRFVTRHQMNQIIDTSVPLFDNINTMLKQFNGILRYANGKYELAIKQAAPASFETYQTINDGDIIGKIKLQDKGQKGAYNSMSAQVIDPQNNYNARSITYFNSTYLKEDKGIRRSGQFAMPGISNYFNSRINIQQFLDESRYGLDVSFTIDSKGYLLLTGEIIQINNTRFNWENKQFRIDSLNFQSNGLVQVKATEHNDSAYIIGSIKSSNETKELELEGSGAVNDAVVSAPAGVQALTASTSTKGAINLAWTNSATFNLATHSTEVWASGTNDRTAATLIYTTQAVSLSDIIVEQTQVTKYYWIRHTVVAQNGLVVPSAYFPTSSTGGVAGSATGAIDGTPGTRGAGRWHIQVTTLPTTSALANSRWGDGSGAQPDAAVLDDQAFFFTGTQSNPTAQTVWIYEGSGAWNKQEEVIDGDLIVNGTITADHISATSGKFKELVVDVGTFETLNTTMLDSDAIVTRDIRVGPSAEVSAPSFVNGTEYYITALGNTTQTQWNTVAGTTGVVYTIGSIFTATQGGTGTGTARNRNTVAKIDGTTLTGKGAHLNSAGDFYLGDASSDKYVFWDQSAGTMELRGTLNAGDINAGSISADRIAAGAITTDKITVSGGLSALTANLGAVTAGTIKGGSIPDANASPTGTEAGAFMDLTGGKMVFGKADKHILFDGTDLILSGVTIDANSIVNSTAGVIVQEDGTSEGTAATTLNFTTGLNLAVTGSTPNQIATISLDSGYATETYVNTAVSNLVDSSPAALDTLNELAAALGDNENFATDTATAIGLKTAKNSNQSLTSAANALTISGSTITLTRGDASTDTITVPAVYVLPANNVTNASVAGQVLTLAREGVSDVTFTNTQYTTATDTVAGLVKIGYTESGKNYPVEIDTDKMYVNVPWSDTNTQRTNEEIRDLAAGIITQGTNVTIVKDDAANTVTISSANTQRTDEEIRDLAAGIITQGTNVTLVKDDAANTVTISSTDTVYTLPNNNVTGASVTDQTLTLTLEGSGADVTLTNTNTEYTGSAGVSLSGTNFSADSTVVRTSGAQSIAGNKTFTNDVAVRGSLSTYDDKILINSDMAGTPASTVTAGIEVARGSQGNKSLVYAENGVGPSDNLAGWTFGSEKVEAGTFYGTFIGDVTGTPSSLAGLTTDNLAEGTNNLYFTDARVTTPARSALSGSNGVAYTTSTGALAVDSTVIRTSGDQSMSGVKTFTGGIALNTANSIYFEGGNHLISYNDGRGNFNIRVGHDDDEIVTEAGYVFHTEWSQSSGGYALNVSPASQTVGEQQAVDFTWREQFKIDSDSVYLRYQGNTKFNTTSAGATLTGALVVTGTVDGRDIAADGTKLNTIDTNANNYSLPTSTASVLGGVKIGSGISIASGVISADSQTANNFTNTLKTKLDDIDANATNTESPALYDNAGTPTLKTGITQSEVRTAIGAGTSSFSGAYSALSGKPTLLTLGTTSSTAMAGNTSLLQIGTTSTTALAGDTSLFDGAYSSLTGTPTIPSAANNATITLAAGNGLTTGGAFTTNQGSNETINFAVGAGTGLTVNANDVAISANTLQAMARGYGWEGTYGSASAAIAESSLYWDLTEKCVVLSGNSDTSIGAAFRAVRVKAGEKVRFTVTVKGNNARSGGMYLRLYQYNGNMPDGKTHVSHSSASGSPFVQEDSSGVTNWYENSAITTSWVTHKYDYTAPASGYVSLVLLNWTEMSTDELYIRQPDISKQTLALGTSSTTALAGNTSLLQIGTTSTTALAGNTSYSTLALGTTSTTALAGNTSLLQIGTTSTTALAGNTTIPQGTVTSVSGGTGISVSNATSTPSISLASTLETLGNATFDTLNVDILDADKILTRDIRVGPTGQTGGVDNAAKINGTTLTGSGAALNETGDFFVGNSASAHMFFDQSAGTLAMKSGTSGARTEIVGGTTKVYDSTGTVRVIIGDLS